MSGQPMCPECNTVVEPLWEWCHNCGFDPDGKRPAGSSLLSSTSTSTSTGSAPSSLAGGPTHGLLGDSGTYGAGSPGADLLAPPPTDDQAVSGPPAGAAPAFDPFAAPNPASFAPSPPPDASAPVDQSAPFDMSAIFDTPSVAGAPPIDHAEPFDTSAIFGAPTTFEAPNPGSFGGEGQASPGGAFDALQSVTGPAAPLTDWDSSAPPTPAPAALADDPQPAPPPGSAPIGQTPGLSGRLTLPGQARPVGAPGTKLPKYLRSRRSVPPIVVRGALIVVATLTALGFLTLFVATTSNGPRSAATTTTLDPSAPPPIGQLPLGGRSPGADPAAAPVPDPDWTTFQSPDGTFSATFPVAPEGRVIEAVPAMLIDGGYEATTLEGTASFAVVASDMAPAFVFDPAAELAAFNWTDAGPFEVSPGIVATGFVGNPDTPEARGFVLMKGTRIYRVVATGATDEDYHSFIYGFRWIADPA